MTDNLTIRRSTPDDLVTIEAIYPLAFPDEDLLPVVRDLLADPDIAISLVAQIDGEVVGHVIFTECSVNGDATAASLLAPLAVTPTRHGQGIGSALVREGLKMLQTEGVGRAFVLGDPAYYGRFGFRADSIVQAPYTIPAAWASAWQSLTLGDTSTSTAGKLSVPAPWLDPALWSE